MNKIEYLGELEDFVKNNEKLVHEVCKKYKNSVLKRKLEYNDLFQEGMYGLILAYKRFDVNFLNKDDKIIKPSTFCIPYIKGKVLIFLRDYSVDFKLSRDIQSIVSRINKELDTGDFKNDDVQKTKEYLESEKIYIDSIKKGEYDFSNILYSYDNIENIYIEEFKKILKEKERKVLEMRIMDVIQYDIAENIGVSQVQVSRILKKIRNKYKEFYKL